MSSSKHINLICIIITIFALVITVLFMNGEKFGLNALTSDKQADNDGVFSDRDLDASWDETTAVRIQLDDMENLADQGAYVLDGNLYIVGKGTYVLSGSLTDHQVIVNAKNIKLQLVLDGVDIDNESLAAIYVKAADKVFLTLADGSENFISSDCFDGETDENDVDAAIYSMADLSINGSGSLSVNTSDSNGIKTTEDLVIAGGNITVDAEKNALVGKDSVRICGGAFDLTAGKDGIKANNDSNENKGYVIITGGDFTIAAAGDGIQAETDVDISGGDFNIMTGGGASEAASHTSDMDFGGFGRFGGGAGETGDFGKFFGFGNSDKDNDMDSTEMSDMQMPEGFDPGDGQSMPEQNADDDVTSSSDTDSPDSFKGIKAGRDIAISDGTFNLDCADDGIHSNGDVTITNGTINIASGDDGIHADDMLSIYDGTITVSESYEGLEGNQILIYDGTISVTSSDDGMNANGGSDTADPLLRIMGGTIYVNAGGDGLDSNADLIIDGGDIIVAGPSDSANGALDSGSENGGECVVNGGTIIAYGASGMAESFESGSEQYYFSVNLGASFASGNVLEIADGDGEVIYTCTLDKSGNSIVFSSPDLEDGATYTVTAGETSAEVTVGSSSSDNNGMPDGGRQDNGMPNDGMPNAGMPSMGGGKGSGADHNSGDNHSDDEHDGTSHGGGKNQRMK